MENWRDIPNYEGIYEASTFGQIRTKEGKTTQTRRHGVRHWKQRVLKPKMHRTKNGRIDARVELWKNGAHSTFLVSRLVAMTWVDGYSPELTVNHRDGNPLNNCAENLEWVSLSDNIRHGFINNLYSSQIPVRLMCGDKIAAYRSYADASRAIGRNCQYISNQLKRGKQIIGADGAKYAIEKQEEIQ